MADISKIITPDGTTYDIKDKPSRTTALSSILFGRDGLPILGEKTYTDVIATANDHNGAGFFYLKVIPDYYQGNTTTVDSRELWHVKTRVIATVPGQSYYYTDSVFDIWGRENTYCLYSSSNQIYSTSYRPIYYNSVFYTNATGYANGCGHWIGFNLYSSTNPTNTSYKRTITVQLLAYNNCTVELQDSLITPTNIPERAAHTGWYTSTNTSYGNYDACSNGLKQTGDANSTTIHALYRYVGNYVANSALYRYQLLFQMDENQLTPLNNNDNVTGTTKTMLTNVEFDPFGWIYYYSSTTTVSAAGSIGAGSLMFHYGGIDLRYTFNCGTTLTAHKPFYLVVAPLSNGKCKIASPTPWSQALPNTNDGNWYILLGRAYSTYQLTLYNEHPVYYYDGTSVKRVLPPTATATTSVSGLMSAEDKAILDSIESTKMPIVSFGERTTIVDTTTVSFSKDGDNNRYISSVNPISGMTYKANTVYKVTWDGVEYECFYSFLKLKTSAGAGAFTCAYIGNAAILDCDNTFKSDDTVPFIVAKRPIQTENNNIYILTTSTAASHTIKIEEIPFTKVVVNRLYYDHTAKDNDFAYRDGSGDGAIMLGAANKSSGESSVAAGDGSIATEMSSIALGHVCAATAAAAIATGAGTTASGQCSHTEGTKTIASASSAHAEGLETIASGKASHTEGQYTIANHFSQHVFGIYNIPDPSTELATDKGNYVEIVGNGTADNARSNARTLDWSGNEELLGTITAAGFVGDLTGNAATATKATQDESGNNIKSSYAASISVSGSTLTLSNKNGSSISTATLPTGLPSVTSSDNGKFLRVVNGVWAAVQLPSASGVSF